MTIRVQVFTFRGDETIIIFPPERKVMRGRTTAAAAHIRACHRPSPAARTSASADRVVILDTKRGRLYMCHGIQAEFWRRIAGGEAVEQIAEAVSRRSGEPPNNVQLELEAFLDELRSKELIVEDDRSSWTTSGLLAIRALWALIAYDLQIRILGFRGVYASVTRACPRSSLPPDGELTARVVAAVSTVSNLYWHRVRCLQRSVATTRVLRSLGVPAQLIIGYRSQPFLFHAWVEVGGRVVNDSQALPLQLTELDRV